MWRTLDEHDPPLLLPRPRRFDRPRWRRRGRGPRSTCSSFASASRPTSSGAGTRASLSSTGSARAWRPPRSRRPGADSRAHAGWQAIGVRRRACGTIRPRLPAATAPAQTGSKRWPPACRTRGPWPPPSACSTASSGSSRSWRRPHGSGLTGPASSSCGRFTHGGTPGRPGSRPACSCARS